MQRTLKNTKILITCGPTWVPIDEVRLISNRSTGALGQIIAHNLSGAGARVTLFEGPVAQRLNSKSIRVVPFTFFDDFAKLMKKALGEPYDVCIHAAAVSDYRPKKVRRIKISSRLKTLNLELVPTPKIISWIKKANQNLFLVGFKQVVRITPASARQKARALVKRSGCDLVIANSADGPKYTGFIIDKHNMIRARASTRLEISRKLTAVLAEELRQIP